MRKLLQVIYFQMIFQSLLLSWMPCWHM